MGLLLFEQHDVVVGVELLLDLGGEGMIFLLLLFFLPPLQSLLALPLSFEFAVLRGALCLCGGRGEVDLNFNIHILGGAG